MPKNDEGFLKRVKKTVEDGDSFWGIKNSIYKAEIFIRGIKWAIFGYEFCLKRSFRRRHGYPLDLENPKTFSEKIQWIKVYGDLERFSKYCDKYSVREFVKERVGKELLIPLIGVYERFSDIDLNLIPNSFVMKATHGSGWNVIVKDKTRANWNFIKKKMNEWLKINYYKKTGEKNYKPLKGRIIIEEYIDDPSGEVSDYKFYCFHGEPKFVEVHCGRFTDHRCDVYDLEWNKLPAEFSCPNQLHPTAKPEKIDNMVDICRKLSHDFAFVRVDLYYSGGRVYFGELTFSPANGFDIIIPIKYDYMLGEHLDLNKAPVSFL
jgi:hypothetical protein